jgi:hypothetical protein
VRLEQIVNPHQITDKRPKSFPGPEPHLVPDPAHKPDVCGSERFWPPNPSQSRYAQDCGRILVQLFRKACVLFVRWRSDKLKN